MPDAWWCCYPRATCWYLVLWRMAHGATTSAKRPAPPTKTQVARLADMRGGRGGGVTHGGRFITATLPPPVPVWCLGLGCSLLAARFEEELISAIDDTPMPVPGRQCHWVFSDWLEPPQIPASAR
jgi:hypothetical protein